MKRRLAAIAAAALLCGCAHNSVRSLAPLAAHTAVPAGKTRQFAALPPAVPIHNAQIDANIDREVTGADRAALRHIMALLPEDARTNVLVHTDHGLISNHMQVARSMVVAPADAKTFFNGSETVPAPHRFTAKGRRTSGIAPPTSDQNGPFVRTYSPTNHTYMSAYPALPCTPTPDLQPGTNPDTNQPYTAGPYGDTGYLYFANFTPADDFEGGLQYSRTHDWYVPYTRDSKDNQGQLSANNYELACGQNVNALNLTYRQEFFVVDNNLVGMHWRGWSARNESAIVDITETRNAGANSGWTIPPTNGCNCTLSVTTSIAQFTNYQDGYWKDGYWFGVYLNRANLQANWHSVTLGDCLINSNNTTQCSTGIATTTAYHDRFPNDPNQTYWQFGGSNSMDTNTGIALAVDIVQSPRTPSSYNFGGSPVPTPSPEPTPACAPDSYGYCLVSSNDGTYTDYCYDANSNLTSRTMGSATYVVQLPDYSQATSTHSWIDERDGNCDTYDRWDPGEPQYMYGDPGLP